MRQIDFFHNFKLTDTSVLRLELKSIDCHYKWEGGTILTNQNPRSPSHIPSQSYLTHGILGLKLSLLEYNSFHYHCQNVKEHFSKSDTNVIVFKGFLPPFETYFSSEVIRMTHLRKSRGQEATKRTLKEDV
jgi:hypothetical protein